MVRGLGGGIWGTVFSVLGVNNGIKNSRRERPIGGVREAPPMSRAPLVSHVQSTPGTAHSGSPRRVAKAGITDEPIGRVRTLPLLSLFSPGPSRCVKSPVCSLDERVCPPSVPARETKAEVGSLPSPSSFSPSAQENPNSGARLPCHRGISLFFSLCLSIFSSLNDRVKPYETRSVCTGHEGRAHRRGTPTGEGRVSSRARVYRRTSVHTYAHVHASRVAPRRRRRASPPRAQSHVGGRPPSVLKYPGPGEPSSRAAMPLLSMTTTSRARFSSPVFSLYSLFLLLSLSFSLFFPLSMYLFLFLFVSISFSIPAPTSRSFFFPSRNRSRCHFFVAPVSRHPFVLARTPFQGSVPFSFPVTPINPSARSTYSGAPSGTRLASLRSAINRRA